jgi:glyoxylase-like metal-dependent hydrolase (beta-lactamase superfamily II)
MLQLGAFRLHLLSDGYFRLDGGAMFGVVPKPLWEKRAPADDRNRILMGIRPLLIQTGTQNVLIDAGIGDKMSAKDAAIYGFDRAHALDQSLAAVDLSADDIDVVIASHLHFDHAGGFTIRENGVVRPKFPRARYIIRRGEWEDALHPHERNRASYFAENYVPLQEAGVLDLHEGDDELLPGITARRTGGHTMHHQLIEIQSGGRIAIFAADMLPTTAHLDLPWIMGYDLYPMDTMAYKKQFLREAVEREYLVLFEHDPAIAAGVIREKEGRKIVEPVRIE